MNHCGFTVKEEKKEMTKKSSSKKQRIEEYAVYWVKNLETGEREPVRVKLVPRKIARRAMRLKEEMKKTGC